MSESLLQLPCYYIISAEKTPFLRLHTVMNAANVHLIHQFSGRYTIIYTQQFILNYLLIYFDKCAIFFHLSEAHVTHIYCKEYHS